MSYVAGQPRTFRQFLVSEASGQDDGRRFVCETMGPVLDPSSVPWTFQVIVTPDTVAGKVFDAGRIRPAIEAFNDRGGPAGGRLY